MKTHESRENYLEAILILAQNGKVRAIDVAHHMQFSKPSVSRAMSLLKNEKLISIDNAGHIELTQEGRNMAERIYERHRLLANYLQALGVSPQVAAEDACRIEHVISDESFEKIKSHVSKHLKK
ncbi:MAG TPA: metal-dependent transcriptional regulator [Candidatus Rifleibacterium sp.]|jgi:Mn-dependent DtxR family transcriptional regulator|nr:metal-dependent transcriptional regulator [Candidatus Rifleibacterium sp.]HNW10866.1 metal-dependent transcriptional regulator [Candidatus Rifleibacterium sp.]HOI89161.1 metal-dependent transcriptional regulator [Candidatus Rifleibacterium sp.]HQB83187.1 metal-dependent transcriptional regulator [Candidatus Rifleibacterium sp.]